MNILPAIDQLIDKRLVSLQADVIFFDGLKIFRPRQQGMSPVQRPADRPVAEYLVSRFQLFPFAVRSRVGIHRLIGDDRGGHNKKIILIEIDRIVMVTPVDSFTKILRACL
jgi:hypothetical protein